MGFCLKERIRHEIGVEDVMQNEFKLTTIEILVLLVIAIVDQITNSCIRNANSNFALVALELRLVALSLDRLLLEAAS